MIERKKNDRKNWLLIEHLDGSCGAVQNKTRGKIWRHGASCQKEFRPLKKNNTDGSRSLLVEGLCDQTFFLDKKRLDRKENVCASIKVRLFRQADSEKNILLLLSANDIKNKESKLSVKEKAHSTRDHASNAYKDVTDNKDHDLCDVLFLIEIFLGSKKPQRPHK